MLEPWRFRYEEMLDGYGTLCMAEVGDGTLYFGGTEGLVYYDGARVTQIRYSDELLEKIGKLKAKPWLKAVIALERGGVLAVVGNSLVHWSEKGWEIVILNVGPSLNICSLKQGPGGGFWLLLSRGLWRISPDLEEIEKVVSGLKPFVLSSFCFDEAGDVWFVGREEDRTSSLNHIPLVNGKPTQRSLRAIFPIPSHKQVRLSSLARGGGGLIWYGDRAATSGFIAFDTVSREWVQEDVGIAKMPIYSMAEGKAGSVWGGLAGSLCRIDGEGQFIEYKKNQLRLPQLPLSVIEASDGRLWVIGYIGYVYSIDLSSERWVTYENLHFQCETEEGVRWFIERSGAVVRHDTRSGEWLQYGASDGLISSPEVLIESSHGLIWAAGSHLGQAAIAVYDGERWDRRLHGNFAFQIDPGSAYEAQDGTVWFGAGGSFPTRDECEGGALRYEVLPNREVRLKAHYRAPLFMYYARSFAETSDAFWVGGSTLEGYDKEITKRLFSIREPRNSIVDLLVDKDDSLWGAQENLGIFQRKEGVLRKYTGNDGVKSQLLADLVLLSDGSIMSSSDKGISRFDGETWSVPAYLKDFAMSKNRSEIRESRKGELWFNFDAAEFPAGRGLGDTEREVVRASWHRPETIPPQTFIGEYSDRVAQPGNSHIEWSGHDFWGGTQDELIQYSWRLDEGNWSSFSYEKGHNFLNLDHGLHVLEVRARDEAFNVDPTPDRVEFAVVPPIWRQLWFIAMLTFFVGLILVLVRIIIKVREQRLQAMVKEQEAREKYLVDMDRLKTGFFTNISHELRTPLTVILGPLQRMMEREEDPETLKMMGMMERNARRAAALISQLLDIRSLEENKLRVALIEGDLGTFIKEVVASLSPLAAEGEIFCQLADPLPCQGWYDPDKFQKIVTNLVSNAIKYTPAGGEVRIKLELEVDDDAHRWAKFQIEDTGSGIDPEHCSRIFERFYRIPEGKRVEGSGIGLNLAYELVALLKGTIEVESPIQEDVDHPGSRFTVRLPLDRDRLPQDSTIGLQCDDYDSSVGATESDDDRSSVTSRDSEDEPLILVVEDDDDIRTFIARILEPSYRVELTSNGDEGLAKANELVPDLVITDLMMPIKNGIELCVLLKANRETCHIPVIMLTAKGSLDSQMAGLKTGADDYVTKPFNPVLLQTRIRNLLESRRKLRALYESQLIDAMDAVTTPLEDGESVSALESEAGNSLDEIFMDSVGSILRERVFDQGFNAEDLAQALKMSPRSVRRKIKALTGRSPLNLIIERRLKKAAELLAADSVPITEIAYTTGFSDYGNFFRQFRKEFDMSPSDYRERHEKT